MKNSEYLASYEEKLTEIVVNQCTSKGFLDGQLLRVEELEEKWREMAPEYIADAIPQVNDYPAVSIAWAAYLGMGIAAMWDGDWAEFQEKKDLYVLLRNRRGFDQFDEFVVEELLGLSPDSEEVESIQELLRGCAHSAMTMIRNEEIEPQSSDAFYIFAHTVKVFFVLGVALELKLLGYKYEKVSVDLPN